MGNNGREGEVVVEKIIDKCLSGRFIFTIITALVFAYLAITKTLGIDKVTEIILLVVYAYFTRQDRTNGGAK